MCSVLMLKLRGFKASFNLLSGKKHGGEKSEKSSDIPVLGAYRRNKEEYYVNNIPNNSPRKLTPTMTSNQQRQVNQHFKSTSNLLSVDEKNQNTRRNTSDIPSGRERKQSREHNEQRKSESQKPEQRKREKPPRNINKTKETNEPPHQEKPRKEKKKGRAPKPPTIPQHTYSSNTLESSISRSSGPPPYSAEVVPNQYDNTGNTSFSKPLEESSWDLVSQHREQLNRPQAKSSLKPTSKVLDLHYNAGIQTSVEVKNNSEV
ncbi:hypothetical protein RR46_14670 [Papilio xuthus]|uniref:Uncharacterized protein n=1 Tax=Papilio xuthus TaxID=66420 RepID=A0A194PCX4_PAPXU|nr:hypothetical protein RR46_14670 [Papilio xuthus]